MLCLVLKTDFTQPAFANAHESRDPPEQGAQRVQRAVQEDVEPSEDQLSAIAQQIAAGQVPYADFAIFGQSQLRTSGS